MRKVSIIRPVTIDNHPSFDVQAFLDTVVFSYPKWVTEEWAPAFERVTEEIESVGYEPTVESNKSWYFDDKDCEKINEAISTQFEKMNFAPSSRRRIIRFAHAFATAIKVKDRPKPPAEAKAVAEAAPEVAPEAKST